MAKETAEVGNNSREKLKSIVERLEALAQEKKTITTDEKDVMAEAKSAGFVPKEIRGLLRRRQMDPDQKARAAELEEAIDRLEFALGGQAI